MEPKNYLTNGTTPESWLMTIDHKRIAILYLFSVTALFFVGGFAALMMRLQLLSPNSGLVQAETYNKLFTTHGVTMVFFFMIPAIPGVLGNFLIPIMVGAKDMAFPRLNLASWYVFTLGAIFSLGAMVLGGVDTGWTFYTPYSSTYSNTHVIVMGLGIFITSVSHPS